MRGRETAPREWICRPLVMGRDYTAEIPEGKGILRGGWRGKTHGRCREDDPLRLCGKPLIWFRIFRILGVFPVGFSGGRLLTVAFGRMRDEV